MLFQANKAQFDAVMKQVRLFPPVRCGLFTWVRPLSLPQPHVSALCCWLAAGAAAHQLRGPVIPGGRWQPCWWAAGPCSARSRVSQDQGMGARPCSASPARLHVVNKLKSCAGRAVLEFLATDGFNQLGDLGHGFTDGSTAYNYTCAASSAAEFAAPGCPCKTEHASATPMRRDYPPLYKPVNTYDALNDASRWQPLVLQPANSPNALGAPYIQVHITPQARPHSQPRCRQATAGLQPVSVRTATRSAAADRACQALGVCGRAATPAATVGQPRPRLCSIQSAGGPDYQRAGQADGRAEDAGLPRTGMHVAVHAGAQTAHVRLGHRRSSLMSRRYRWGWRCCRTRSC